MNLIQSIFDCQAPVALVTGSGAPRVGRAVAVELARAGCRIAIHANTSRDDAQQLADELSDRFNTESIVTLGAVEQDGVAEKLVQQAVASFGRLDVLVNSAAIWRPTKLEEVTADEIRHYFDVNAVGTFLCARAAGNAMSSQSTGGSIVNLGDWATVRPYMDHAAYFPSKGAIDVMTRSLAVEFAARNPAIRVNCIKPGPVLLADDVTSEQREKLARSTLCGKVGTAEHIAHAVRFLCENTFVNGT